MLAVLVAGTATACSGDTSKRLPVFVFAGQSNMQGVGTNVAEVPAGVSRPHAEVLFWDDAGHRWRPLAAPTEALGRFGPEVAAGPALAKRLGRRIALVKFAVGTTTLAVSWNPADRQSLFAQLVERVTRATEALPTGQGVPQVAGFFWVQGDTDAIDPAMARAYGENLHRLLAAARAEFDQPDLPCVLGRIRDYGTELPDSRVVRAAITDAARNVRNVVAVETTDLALATDGLHLSSVSTLELGNRLARAYARLTR